jgi:hypothetical protein
VSAASLALELLRQRPGALQVRLSALDGALQPLSGVGRGAVIDAEASRGGGVEIAAVTPGQRARLAAGYTRSTFDNPARDSQLTGGLVVRPSLSDQRGARYLESSLNVLNGARLFRRVPTQLTVSVRHERVDPLFRSVGASTQADREQNALDLSGAFGALALQGGVTRARDNLGAIASVLTSHTDGATANASASLATLLGVRRYTVLWPQLSASWTSAHQFAVAAPASNDFRPQDLANQASTVLDATSSWQRGAWRASVHHTRSTQDNRQVGRELADFAGATTAVSVSSAVGTSFDLSVDGGIELQRNLERDERNRVRRIGTAINWRATSVTALSANVTAATSLTPPSTHDVTNMELRFELSQRVPFSRRTGESRGGQAFLRFARSSVTAVPFSIDSLAPAPRATTRMQWTLNSGLSLHLW